MNNGWKKTPLQLLNIGVTQALACIAAGVTGNIGEKTVQLNTRKFSKQTSHSELKS